MGYVIATWIIWIDQHKCPNLFPLKICHKIICRIMQLLTRRSVKDALFLIPAIRIFLKCRTDKSNLSIHLLHQTFDQLCCSISHQNMLLPDAKIFACQKAVDTHPGRILGKQRFKVRLHLIHKPPWREIGIDQITKINHTRISPISPIPSLYL